MNNKKVGNVILAVKDLDKSLEFYHEWIGLPIKNQRRTWIDLGTSGGLLSLHPAALSSEHTGTSIDDGITIGFIVMISLGLQTFYRRECQIIIIRKQKMRLLKLEQSNQQFP